MKQFSSNKILGITINDEEEEFALVRIHEETGRAYVTRYRGGSSLVKWNSITRIRKLDPDEQERINAEMIESYLRYLR